MSDDSVKEIIRVHIQKPSKKDEWTLYNPDELIPIEEFLKDCGFDELIPIEEFFKDCGFDNES